MRIPNGFGQVNWIFSGDQAPTGAQITCGYAVNPLGGTVADEAEFFWDAFRDEVLPELSDGITLSGVLVKHGPNATGPSALYTASQVGGIVSAGAPANTAILVSKVTDLGGRSGKGRLFCPGLPDDDVDGSGHILSAKVADLQTAFDLLYARMVDAVAPPVLLHGDASSDVTPEEITAFVVQGTAATQRRRMRR